MLPSHVHWFVPGFVVCVLHVGAVDVVVVLIVVSVLLVRRWGVVIRWHMFVDRVLVHVVGCGGVWIGNMMWVRLLSCVVLWLSL